MIKKNLLILFTILSALTLGACGSSSGGSGGGGGGGGNTINTSGGNGGNQGGIGASAGVITIQKSGGDGPVEILTTGTVDTSITAPVYSANFGPNPLEVSGTVNVELNPVAGIAIDLPYIETTRGFLLIRISDGNGVLGDEPAVTGIKINGGGRLVLPLNTPPATPTRAGIYLIGDIENNGTITTLDYSPVRRGSLKLNLQNYYATGDIETFGSLEGQSGGEVRIIALSMFMNQGMIKTDGANSTGNGGIGSLIRIDVNLDIYNTGMLSATGGNSSTATGVYGDTIELISAYGKIYNSGNIFSNGGDGATGGGGSGKISLFANNNSTIGTGGIINSGNIEIIGGRATQTGDGGSAFSGGIILRTYGGGIKSSGDILTYGGNTADPAGSGGGGQYIALESFPGFVGGNPVAAGSVEISGNLHTYSGSSPATGSGNAGAIAGTVSITLDASGEINVTNPRPSFIPPVKLGLYGYSQIITNGGKGNTGGNGGTVTVDDIGRRWNGATFQDIGGGNITVTTNISALGGSVPSNSVVLPATGGFGGDVIIGTTTANTDRIYLNTVTGDIDSSGGDSRGLTVDLNVTNGGRISVGPLFGELISAGAYTSNGGTDTGATGFGYDGGVITPAGAFATVTADGVYTANGGNGATTGGDGGTINMDIGFGTAIFNGNASARGGNGSAGTGTGGAGGTVSLSVGIGTCTDNGMINVSGGSGNTPGAIGTDNTC